MKYYCLAALLTIITISTMTGCIGDCNQMVSGIVLDSLTKKPLDSVLIVNVNKGDRVYSDSLGNFVIHSISGGFTGCPAMTVSVSKDGYTESTNTYSSGQDVTLYLSHIK